MIIERRSTTAFFFYIGSPVKFRSPRAPFLPVRIVRRLCWFFSSMPPRLKSKFIFYVSK